MPTIDVEICKCGAYRKVTDVTWDKGKGWHWANDCPACEKIKQLRPKTTPNINRNW